MNKKTLKKKQKKNIKKILEELAIANTSLTNETLFSDLKYQKEQWKLQKIIHKKQGWKEYTC